MVLGVWECWNEVKETDAAGWAHAWMAGRARGPRGGAPRWPHSRAASTTPLRYFPSHTHGNPCYTPGSTPATAAHPPLSSPALITAEESLNSANDGLKLPCLHWSLGFCVCIFECWCEFCASRG